MNMLHLIDGMIFETRNNFMYRFSFILFLILITSVAKAQDTLATGTITYTLDPRLETLGNKMAEYNDALAATAARTAKGYRLMVLSTSDRNEALNLRTRLLQLYPDQKVYMIFQSPYIKVKFGNFLEKKDAERTKKQLNDTKVVTGNIYVVAEKIEIKPEKPETDE